ncbi:SLBB domain-containing protein [Massilia terrae]|uniref:SLBB domain-containing protein n=1 Tax=Massilia terrae TaxID=1811224 RepID=A0ABT2CW48_9BURK|nr:SLBB domain-containing protein [Massilia terrae]MCS0658164.1 SLBB domain-containing protein [Massilia terrae]
MFNIKIGFATVAMAVAAIAPAQEKTDFKSDLFGQEAQASVGELAPAQAPHKVTITNGSTSDAAAAGAGAAGAAQGAASREANNVVQSEFQKFLAENTGRSLPIFGSEFFANAPSTFAPVANTPVPSDYQLGPGDQLLIRGWGTIDIDYRATIDRNGSISLPTLGTISLAGVRAGQAESVIRGAVGKLYKGVTLSVTFGQLRAITVYVVGQAQRPGTYTVSSLSTLVTALFASGGPNANGSMRHVQVKRGGTVAAELDLYSFIARGDKSADIKLLDGDTIYIPPAGGFVALVGKVNSPAIYELKDGKDTIESLLNFAGGLPVVADPRRAFLERINAEKNHPRSVEEFALDAQGLKRPLKNGDVLNIISITPDFSNAVVLRGNVDQPVRAPFKPGMRVSDLIPSREYLITRGSVKRQNSAIVTGDNDRATNEAEGSIAGRIGGLIDPINWDYAVVERVNRSDVSVSLLPFNLGNVFSNPAGADNILLQPGDTVTIFSQADVAVPLDKRRVFVRVEGEVKVPGVYQMTANDTVQTMLAKAGGATSNAYLFGTAFYRETARREQQANLEKVADKLENQLRSEQVKGAANVREFSGSDAAVVQAQRQMQVDAAKESLNRFRHLKATGRIALSLDPNERSFSRLPQLKLENGDRLVVPAKPAFVNVFGAVNLESSLLWRPNSRVSDYLKSAGLTPDADVDNVFVMRADGSVVSAESKGWFFGSIGGLEVMPGDSVVIPQKFDRESRWTAFTRNTREWAQIFANFGLGAAAIKTLRN